MAWGNVSVKEIVRLTEFASLGENVGALVLVGSVSEMADSLTGILLATEEEDVGTSGVSEGELVKSEAFTTGSEDTGTSSGGESEGSDRQLGDIDKTGVIGDRGDSGNGLSGCHKTSTASHRDQRVADKQGGSNRGRTRIFDSTSNTGD